MCIPCYRYDTLIFPSIFQFSIFLNFHFSLNFQFLNCTYRMWKKGQFCPECNICFGREGAGDRGKDLFDEKTKEVEYSFCWVCSRQHHSKCIGDAPRFICQACQRKTQEKCVGLAGNVTSISTEMSANNGLSSSSVLNTPSTSFNFGTPTTSFSSSQRPRRIGVNNQ